MFVYFLIADGLQTIFLDMNNVKEINFKKSPAKNLLIFDFDQTLYDFKEPLGEIHNENKTNFLKKHLKDEYSKELLDRYKEKYGIILLGLKEKGIPVHEILNSVIFKTFSNFSLPPDVELAEILRKIPGDKWIFTNNQPAIVERLLEELGIKNEFEFLFVPDFYLENTPCKPKRKSFDILNYIISNKRSYDSIYFLDDSEENISMGEELHWISILTDCSVLKEHLKKIFLQ
ncbi:pyrimidine 5'-nucleotidase [Anncaliia algerae PRA339]|uniref:Pyrimidine 5'-nucleotidase n=1 Tax=Anncaliia algerae PRA339 TaxID=1288291 RepID=A0A059EZ88_9MICR|nr:pyrimidine 5'-nucleotidase [Anncaliia algerae PRA339]